MVNRSTLCWSFAQTGAVVIALLLFILWAPWLGARSREEATALYGKAIPENCEAITVNHGQFSCLPWGTVSSNPWGFAACTVLLVATVLFLVLSVRRDKGLFSPEPIEATRSTVNRVGLKIGLPEFSAKHARRLISLLLFVAVFASIMLVANVLPTAP